MSAVVFKVLSEARDISLKQAESAVGGVTQAIVAAHPGVDMPGNRIWNKVMSGLQQEIEDKLFCEHVISSMKLTR